MAPRFYFLGASFMGGKLHERREFCVVGDLHNLVIENLVIFPILQFPDILLY